jgi:hypothetical protein
MESVRSKSGLGGLALWARGSLPAGHLLDATWWFDSCTVFSFRERILRQSAGGRVAFLGTPSLFLDGLHQGSPVETWLFDQDDAIRKFLSRELQSHFVVLDLTRNLPQRIGAELVIADPPWYMAELEAFLAAAQAVSSLGATVEISIPPIGVRPGIEKEREQLFTWANAGGLQLVEILQNATCYDTPAFERNTLHSVGEQTRENWRFGDLAIFNIERLNGLLPRRPLDERRWADVELLDTRWRVAKVADAAGNDPSLISMGWPDDIFPSCSRRHAQRNLPSVWTSGNRVFECRNPGGLLEILRSIKGETLPEVISRAHALYPKTGSPEARTATQIVTVLETEQREVEALRTCLNGKEL